MGYMFRNDYSELAHERIINALAKYSKEQNIAYGLDYHSENASNKIKEIFGVKNANVHFLAGGTQTNMAFISYVLRPYEGVVCCASGHINVHETAAVEGSGHKVFTVEGKNGKVYPEDVLAALKKNCDEHMVKIKMVYISNSTEIGTIYTKDELKALKKCCDENKLYLFIDGARLGSALTSEDNDCEATDIGKYSDAFYIGGTKNGMLFGEALVIVNKDLQEDFRYHIKNKGAMLAKGYAVGIEFEEAFKDGLYFELAKHANKMAKIIKETFIEKGFAVLPSPTNQLFVTFERNKALEMINKFGCELWEDLGDKITIRFVTSFNTSIENVNELIEYIK